MRMMKYLVAGMLLAAVSNAQADTMRCGSQLVTTGDRTFEVERKCGTPEHRDLVGYTLSRNDRQEFALEEWVYGPRNGMLSILTFEGNRLVRIETRRAN
ncbi:MAG: DUF2845 domain-containing protein [Gammaproteobacteria bacterium HGW-Gammaproteobacteria-9]|jgi:Protein of unknown function (DUF2845).|uniref:DUF2845 domain-containing protein n=1 Tax=Stutzerimonas stutzeri RCH2 TaxID=644801 RepID=L0GFQ8_STUST|nr:MULTISPECIES: DUF2845 domain-containing protein [Pseudomonadaceae]AGA85563.1 Protein of unknown function (DUF2845) [Stutzerimonas stutzeri RCH2]OCX94456.1 MAG: hypothetical protein BFD77_10015 [Pseudomonas sp. CO183]PKL97297.1 MAG: DUF2845 domain-containing protein [Gammaproteobacteria bacterium HGW-Gammaproteobacteria-9]GCA58059.1 hypothetical protein PSCT_04279 [Pseudomonas sp. SCT]